MERIIQNYQEKLDSVTSNYQVSQGSWFFTRSIFPDFNWSRNQNNCFKQCWTKPKEHENIIGRERVWTCLNVFDFNQEKVNILERRLVDKDIEGNDKSAPQSARYHNMGPAEAGRLTNQLFQTWRQSVTYYLNGTLVTFNWRHLWTIQFAPKH